MSCITGHSRDHTRITRKLLTLTRKAINLFHPSRFLAVVTDRKGQRFSLISRSDYSASVAPQIASPSQRDSETYVEVSGLHVVCAECDGFAIKKGAVRSCHHQTDSSSSISEQSGRIGREAANESEPQTADVVGTNLRLSKSGFVRELGTRAHSKKSAHLYFENARKARSARAVKHSRGITSTSTTLASVSSSQYTAAAGAVADTVLRAGNIARGNRSRRRNETQASLNDDAIIETYNSVGSDRAERHRCDPETLMQNWREWSERWKRLASLNDDTIIETDDSVASDKVDQPRCDPEALMQNWREWSERWEKSVRSR